MRFLLSSLLSLLFLFVCCANAVHGAQQFYAGRSAPIQFQPQQPADLFCVLQDPSARYFARSSSTPNEMSVVNVFDGAATAMALSALNQDRHSALNTDFVRAEAFDRPRANVFIGVDAVGRKNVDASVMPHLSELLASSSSSSLSFSLSDAEPSVISPALPTVASIATASPVSAHGIVNRMWQGKHGSPVSAYSSSDSSSWAHRATFADILSQAFSGKSMTLSFSSQPQVAAAFGVNTLLQQEKPSWNNFIVSLDETGDAFAPNHESSLSSIPRVPLSNLKEAALSAQSFLHQLSRSDEHFQLQIVPSDSTVHVTKGQSTSIFDLSQHDDLMFFAELQYIHGLPDLVHSTQLADLVTDSFPDALAINIASTDELAMRYGADSEKFKAALMLLDAALPSLQHRLFGLYPDRAVGELVAMGSPAAVQLDDERAFLDTITKFANYPHLDEYFPLFYLPATQAADSCASINAAVQKFGLNAKCAQGQAVQPAVNAQTNFRTAALALGNSSSNSSIFIPIYYPSETGIEKFQIVLWISVLLAFVLLGVVYSSAYMSFKKDTMLYSTFNPRWEDKKHR